MENALEQETEELRRFREEWKQELQSRLEHHSPSSTKPQTAVGGAVGIAKNAIQDEEELHQHHVWSRSSAALDLYTQAVKLETSGDHNAATGLYRRAFRLQEDVDRMYYRSQMASELRARDLSRDVEALSLAEPGPLPKVSLTTASQSLRHILASFPSEGISFRRDLETQPFVFDKLPDEIIIAILQSFVDTADTRSVERFANVSRKARLVTLEPSLWRAFVELIYVPPQLNHPPEVLLSSFQYDYRNLYINQPRVRLDGVYIAACHYVRTGHSENAWVNISHLITYYRYLRFLPNGIVLSLLSSDATLPQQIIPHLKLSGPLTKGMHVGQWSLELPSADVDCKVQRTESQENVPVVVVDGLLDVGIGASTSAATTTIAPKYSFKMTLGLRSKPIGRWNRLDILRYESIHLATDEVTPLPLKHDRPFWFSKVRSYGSGMW